MKIKQLNFAKIGKIKPLVIAHKKTQALLGFLKFD